MRREHTPSLSRAPRGSRRSEARRASSYLTYARAGSRSSPIRLTGVRLAFAQESRDVVGDPLGGEVVTYASQRRDALGGELVTRIDAEDSKSELQGRTSELRERAFDGNTLVE